MSRYLAICRAVSRSVAIGKRRARVFTVKLVPVYGGDLSPDPRRESKHLDEDAEVGPMVWEGEEADGFEELRTVKDKGDAFEPDFEMDTEEHAQWKRDALAAFDD